jgi:hypothetical protein
MAKAAKKKAAKKTARTSSLKTKPGRKTKKPTPKSKTKPVSAKAAVKKKPAKKAETNPRGGVRREKPGHIQRSMAGGYHTCGGTCPDPKPRTDPSDPTADPKIWCNPTCTGEVAATCSCLLYSYPTPAPGNPVPPMDEWKKENDTRIFPVSGTTYKCVCVTKDT